MLEYLLLGRENHSLENLTNPGQSNGLTLTLNVQTEEYQPTTDIVGVKVIIHDQDEPISTSENGFAAMPGRKILVSVTKKKVCWLILFPIIYLSGMVENAYTYKRNPSGRTNMRTNMILFYGRYQLMQTSSPYTILI